MQVKDLFFATGGDVMEAQGQGGSTGGGELSPPLFRKNENKLNKNNLTKVTEPKIAPHSKTCRAIPEETLSL